DVVEREEIRNDRRKERQHGRNIARAGPERRSGLLRDQDRDISEMIALGMPNTRAANNEAQYDQRLFNQRVWDSGFAGGEDETYNVFDQPWMSHKEVGNSIYRPTKEKDQYVDDVESLVKSGRDRFVPDKKFEGAEGRSRHDGPVQFEREEEDPFGPRQVLGGGAFHGGGGKRAAEGRSRDHDDGKKRRKE
uniref:SNW domain-containing protein 1 n=1 Tax=Petromyzon marinus TaxID=7757 RepID=S4RTX3_PETMA